MKNLIILVALFIFGGATAQDKNAAKKAAIANMISTQRYVFKAQTALPSGPAPTRQLTPDYDLKVSKDTVISYLPYYGRAYVAPMDPTKGGIQFTSTKFTYTTNAKKKGGWDIVIKPQDTDDASQMILSVSETGYASLQVLNNNKQPITFTGYITERKSR
jgi:hypothetical protein